MDDHPQSSNLVTGSVAAPEGATPRATAKTTADIDDRAPTAPIPGPYGWADDCLSNVPIDEINGHVVIFTCKLLDRVTRDKRATIELLSTLPRSGSYSKEEEEAVLARIKRGDYN